MRDAGLEEQKFQTVSNDKSFQASKKDKLDIHRFDGPIPEQSVQQWLLRYQTQALAHGWTPAIMARRHNNANVICLGARVTDHDEALKMVDLFLRTAFDGNTAEGERHKRRVCQIDDIPMK